MGTENGVLGSSHFSALSKWTGTQLPVNVYQVDCSFTSFSDNVLCSTSIEQDLIECSTALHFGRSHVAVN